METARAIAGQICAAAPLAVEALLEVARAVETVPDAAAFDVMRGDLPARRRMREADDFLEGPPAFAEKRPPRWSGRMHPLAGPDAGVSSSGGPAWFVEENLGGESGGGMGMLGFSRSPVNRCPRHGEAEGERSRRGLLRQALVGDFKIERELAVQIVQGQHPRRDIDGERTFQRRRDDHVAVSYTHLRAHETVLDLVCRLLLEKKKNKHTHI